MICILFVLAAASMSGRSAGGGGTRYNDRYRSDAGGGASSGTKRPYRADEGSASHRSPTRYPPSKTGRGGERGGGGGDYILYKI